MKQDRQKRKIDYYIYIDYSAELIGYNIIENEKICLILPKIAKFRHYKEERHKKIYLLKIKREIRNSNLTSLLLRQKKNFLALYLLFPLFFWDQRKWQNLDLWFYGLVPDRANSRPQGNILFFLFARTFGQGQGFHIFQG